ncbi:hypothetical protein C8A05DRAFT_29830 [Staphylotrichum tortipilum]|uniref:Uncharacterized protein n=1 Tax=Staphylotrichum tortipilum TaxID=2831512 RepID=A0AAN6MSW1_9PEZI|nr:hypothetical protein C8A05DRAFT_29830 [Staphylotrichum longicolle]
MEDRFNIPVEWPEPPHIEIDPSLRTITRGVPIRATTEERFNDFDRSRVIHVVIQQLLHVPVHRHQGNLLPR